MRAQSLRKAEKKDTLHYNKDTISVQGDSYHTKKPRKFNIFEVLSEARTGFEPVIRVLQTRALPLGYRAIFYYMLYFRKNDSNGNRTRVTAVKGRCLNRLTMEPLSVNR